MTIASEITKLNTNMQNAYSAVNNLGGTLPQSQNMDNLATAISSIQGGSEEPQTYLVKVIDYDGTVLKSENLLPGSTFTMPSEPSHNGLVFQSWSTPVVISSNSFTVPESDIIIGATYNTQSGKNEFDIVLNELTGLTVTLNLSGSKDWGDGTINTKTTHTYTNYGNYTISSSSISATTSYDSGLFGQNSSNPNYYVVGIKISDLVVFNGNPTDVIHFVSDYDTFNITPYMFQYCYSLSYVSIAENYRIPRQHLPVPRTIGNDCFSYCDKLRTIVIPSGTESVSSAMFYACSALKTVALHRNLSTISDSAFYTCPCLSEITLLNITQYGQNCFYGCNFNNITLSNNLTSLPYGCFSYCKNLTLKELPSSLKTLGILCFVGCDNLKLTIPNTVTSVGSNFIVNSHTRKIDLTNITQFVGQVYGTFSFGSSYVEELVFPKVASGVTALEVVGNNLKKITLPTNGITSISLQNCYVLENVDIPDTITTILANCFYGCYSLKNIVFPPYITNIGQYAFRATKSIESFDFSSSTSVPTLSNSNAFTGINPQTKIIVPFDLYSDWIESTNWSVYEKYIEGGVPAVLNFNITSSLSNNTIIIKNKVYSTSSINWWGSQCNYTIISSSGNSCKEYVNSLSNIQEGESYTIDANLNSLATHAITIDTGVSDCIVNIVIGDNEYNVPSSVSDNTKYVFNLCTSENKEIEYHVEHPLCVDSISGTINFQNADITVTTTSLQLGYYEADTTPKSSAGTDGSCYVLNASSYNNNIDDWFDGDTTDSDSIRYEYLTTNYGAVREFNESFKLGKVVFYPYSSSPSNNPQNWYIQGRNSSSESWVDLSSIHIHDYSTYLPSTNPITWNINSTIAYKMYRLLCSKTTSYSEYGSYAKVREIQFYGSIFIPFDMTKKKTFNITTNVADCNAFITNSNGFVMNLNTNGTSITGIAVINDNENVTLTIEKRGYGTYTETITGNASISTYNKNVTLTENNFEIELNPGVTNYGWKESTKTNPKAGENWLMYESNNKGIDSSYAVMKIIVNGSKYSSFTCYINSYAESGRDYTYCTKLDSTTYNSSSSSYIQGQTTSNYQYAPETFNTSNYKTITYTDIPSGEHFFYVVYQKDGSVNKNYDAGFVLINPNQ